MIELKGWLILIIGVGMLLVALQGLFTGALPAGRGGWMSADGKVRRAEQPMTFWLLFMLDAFLGVICLRYGIHAF